VADAKPAGTVHPDAIPTTAWPRRRVLKAIAATGIGSAVFGRAVVAVAEDAPRVTAGMIKKAEWISGLTLTGDDRKMMLDGINEALADYAALRKVAVDNGVAPALQFNPDPAGRLAAAAPPRRGPAPPRPEGLKRPQSDDDLAYAPVATLASLLRARQVSSMELTRLYLGRLERFDPKLLCVITLTEDLALRQAQVADRELASGIDRGPLHGIPWGAKDLLAVPGYRTTWGSVPFKEQQRSEKATVVTRLEEAGAVLLAKLSVGELAWGDVWFGGTTKNPWNLEQGSSGSSAGSASATAAGLMGFAIGTETWGSIVSPCTRCGASGLRPSFGRVSRHGCMALCWTMDKIGPIARTLRDCALVFQAIHGADGLDACAVDRPFEWPAPREARALRVGFVRSLFEEDRTADMEDAGEDQKTRAREWQANDLKTLDELRDMGIDLVPIELPKEPPVMPLALILGAEAAAAFDELTRSGRDDLMVRQIANAWPNVFRQAQLTPAVEYIRANRIRTLLMRAWDAALADVDCYVCPSYGGDNLLANNLTGHPCVVAPNGFTSKDGTPTSITFVGKLHGESDLLALATAWQEATSYHLQRPPLA